MDREEENERADQGFRVTDRRIRFDDEPSSQRVAAGAEGTVAAVEVTAPTPSDAPPAAADVVEGPGWRMEKKPEASEESSTLPPMDFTRFCLTLASSVLIYLGEASDPETGAPHADLSLAKQTIDVLAMLEEKTRGNLTDAEAKLLSTVLYDLRMRFLQRTKDGGDPA